MDLIAADVSAKFHSRYYIWVNYYLCFSIDSIHQAKRMKDEENHRVGNVVIGIILTLTAIVQVWTSISNLGKIQEIMQNYPRYSLLVQ